MRIIVTGCGKIGSTIIASLIAEGHDVVAIDKDSNVVADMTNMYDAMGVCGSGTDCETLTEASVQKAELFVAVTGSDELNMLSCFIATKMGAKHAIARIRNPEYNAQNLSFLRQQLGLSMAINPELLAAREIFNLLKLPSAAKIETFSRRNFEIVELNLKPDSQLIGIPLSRLRKEYKANFLICAVQRGDDVFIPDGNFVLESGDKIGLTAAPTEVHKLLKMLGLMQKQARNVMILGASRTAYYLSRMLISAGNSVKIIEQDKEQCRRFSELLPDAVIIKGDGAQQELLLEEGILSTDAFVSLTGMDEENILISLFASSQNVPKVVSKINRDEFISMASRLGLECFVSPRMTVSDILVRYARALQNSMDSNVETLYKLMDGRVEALEFNILPDCRLINIPLKELKTKPNTLIAGIMRGRKIIIPSGDDCILSGDNVVVLTAGHRASDITDIVD